MKMLGKTNRGMCPCCRDERKKPAKRRARRQEKQAWKKSLTS